MTWMLFSVSMKRPRPPPGPAQLRALPDCRARPGACCALSLPDPLHVAVDGDLAHLHDLAVLDHDEPRPVGRPVILARVGERRGQTPGVEVLETLQRLLDRLACRIRARP